MKFPFRDHHRDPLQLLLERVTVVRVTPADVLVISGVQPDTPPAAFEALTSLLAEAGAQARGVVMLGPGMGIDSIDLDELVRLDQRAEQAAEGEIVAGSSAPGGVAQVPCPRGCGELIPVQVTVHAADDGRTIRTSASTDQAEMGQHGLVCAGHGDTDV